MDYPVPLLNPRDQQAAQRLIERCQLHFESRFDDLIGIFKSGQLAACGARHGRVLKMLVVAPEFRGSGLIGEIITELMRLGLEASEREFFVFTRRCTVDSFTRLGFKLLATDHEFFWLEYGQVLPRRIKEQAKERAGLLDTRNNAAIKQLDSPLSQHILNQIEQAATTCETLYVFISGPEQREIAYQQIDHCRLAPMSNVMLIDLDPYWLQASTFPCYMLRASDAADEIMSRLQNALFEQTITSLLSIRQWLMPVVDDQY